MPGICQVILGEDFFGGLAFKAEVAAAIADGDALNGGAADRARLATSMGYLKLEVGCPPFSAGTKVGIHTCSLITDS